MNPKTPSQPPHRFLFMLPDSTTPTEQDHIVNAAKELTTMGYVYVASARESTMEDRDNVRYMPLKEYDLPCFGEVTGVMIVRDQEMARMAEEAYPGAKVFVIDPSQGAPEAATDAARKPRRSGSAVWKPVMNSPKLSHAAA
jgi:hypothetical protein